jgi:hypothetical protein
MDVDVAIKNILHELNSPEIHDFGFKLVEWVRRSNNAVAGLDSDIARDVLQKASLRTVADIVLREASFSVIFSRSPAEGLRVAVQGHTEHEIPFSVKGILGHSITGQISSVELPDEIAFVLFECAQQALYKPPGSDTEED